MCLGKFRIQIYSLNDSTSTTAFTDSHTSMITESLAVSVFFTLPNNVLTRPNNPASSVRHETLTRSCLISYSLLPKGSLHTTTNSTSHTSARDIAPRKRVPDHPTS